jgi:Trypsin-like peptidase domain
VSHWGVDVNVRADADVNAHAVARIRNEDGVVGSGFLVGPDLVATCAHVVADALGADPYSPSAPDAPVQLDFPLSTNGVDPTRPGDAVVERWVPVAEDGGGDLALLRLTRPPPVGRVPPLRRIDRLWDHGFTVLGFPAGHPEGVWSSGLIRGEQGTRWFQLQSTPGEQRIAGGFSGSPVWEAQSGAVVGVTVAADRGDTTTAFLIPIDQVLALDAALLPCPYQGLRPFDEEHAAMFFGRDEEADALLAAIDRAPVVAVAGPSGAGKSSLVRAGLLPRLRAAGTPVVDLRPVSGAADLTAELDAARTPGSVVVIDQFEELAAVDPAAARRVLEKVVQVTATDAVRAVLTVRWAALDQIVTPELLSVLEQGTVLVAPMSRGRLREAIVGPADRSPGLVFEPGLVDRILDDAGVEPGRLPLVESLLTDMWDRRDGGQLTVRAYEAAGGVPGAVAAHAERAIEVLRSEGDEQGSLDAARRLLTALARPDRNGRLIRRAVALDQLPPAQRALVPALADRRLLVVGRSSSAGAVVELAHQALIDHWPRLRAWLEADHAFLTWRDRVDSQRERWESEGRSGAALLRGVTLAEAAQWLPARNDHISPSSAEYLRRSRARQRWEVRRWRVVTAVLAVLGLLATTAAVVAVDRRQVLADQLAAATAATLARESRDRAPNDSVLAARLALAAFRADPGHPQARTALAASYLALRSADAELADVGPDAITRLEIGGDTAIAVGPPHPVAVTGVAGPQPPRHELPDIAHGHHLAVSPDGRLLADVPPDFAAVRLRDLAAPAPPRPVSDPGVRVAVPRFSPDGTRLMWLQIDAAGAMTMVVRDLSSDAEVPHALGVLPSDTLRAWLTPDPNLVVLQLGREDVDPPETRLSLRSLADGTEAAPLPARSAVAMGGAAVVSCDVAEAGSAVVTVHMIGSSAPPPAIPATIDLCEYWISADGGFVIGRLGLEGPGRDRVRITDLRTGAARELFLPVGVLGDIVWPRRLTTARGVAVAGPPDRPVVLATHHGSVLRLTTRPVLPEQEDMAGVDERPMRFVSDDGRYAVSNPGGALVVEDLGTGQQVAALPGAAGAGAAVQVGTEVVVLTPEPTRWTLSRYEIPTLRRTASFHLPVSAEPAPTRSNYYAGQDAAVVELETPGGGQLLAISDGMLTALDPQTGRPLGPSTALGGTPEEHAWFQRATSRLEPRPGHPGQAVVTGMNGELQLWDAARGERLRTIPTAYRPAIDAAFPWIEIDRHGRHMAVLTPDRAIEVWDLESGRLTGPGIPAPGGVDLVGFDADGELVTYAGTGGRGFEVRQIDVDERRDVATMIVHATVERITGDGRSMRLSSFDGSVPELVPLTATVWRDELCAVLDRPFSPDEAAVLPQGANLAPPCS